MTQDPGVPIHNRVTANTLKRMGYTDTAIVEFIERAEFLASEVPDCIKFLEFEIRKRRPH